MTMTATALAADAITAHELRFERLMPAPIDTVWAYLVDPDLRKLWFMGGATGRSAGEEIEMVMDHRNLSDEDVPMPERYAAYLGKGWSEKIVRIEPPHLLSFTWDNGDAGTVMIELSEGGEGTRLVLTHSGLRGPADAVNFGGGWHAHIEVLKRRIGGERVPDFWALHADAEAKMRAAIGS